jgi:flagellar biosynthesis/type III secretory pathway protein FliH
VSDPSLAVAEARAREEGRRAGFDAGFAEGRRQGEMAVTATLLAARAEAQRLVSEARKVAVPLAVRMAERIVGREIARDPSALLDILSQAVLATGSDAEPVVLRVHPEDARIIEVERARLLAKLGPATQVRLLLDETVGRGGCLVETSNLRLDARLESQLDVLARSLLASAPGESRS